MVYGFHPDVPIGGCQKRQARALPTELPGNVKKLKIKYQKLKTQT